MDGLDERVWAAHADAWQAEGRLRAPLGFVETAGLDVYVDFYAS